MQSRFLDENSSKGAIIISICLNFSSLKTQDNIEVVKSIPTEKLMIETGKAIGDCVMNCYRLARIKNIVEVNVGYLFRSSRVKREERISLLGSELICLCLSSNLPCLKTLKYVKENYLYIQDRIIHKTARNVIILIY